jgi:hypothetical protein
MPRNIRCFHQFKYQKRRVNFYWRHRTLLDVAEIRTMNKEASKIRRSEGIITDDPATGLPIGSKLNFSSVLFSPNPAEGLHAIANWEFFRGAVLALRFGDREGQHLLGSGVIVAPGVVMAARHVLETEENRLRAGVCELICSGICEDGLSIWRCHQVTILENSDIALLMVRRASSSPEAFYQATITTRMPRIGERIVMAGVRHHADRPVGMNRELNISLMVARGVVTARFERMRDRFLLPFPCFEVSCPAAGGMSGGPAFDESGFLLGLVSSSFYADVDCPRYLSLLWPALPEPISPDWPEGFYPQQTTLLNMDRRICGIQKPEAIKMEQDAEGRMIATYHWWE